MDHLIKARSLFHHFRLLSNRKAAIVESMSVCRRSKEKKKWEAWLAEEEQNMVQANMKLLAELREVEKALQSQNSLKS